MHSQNFRKFYLWDCSERICENRYIGISVYLDADIVANHVVIRSSDLMWVDDTFAAFSRKANHGIRRLFSRFVTPRGRWLLAVVETDVADAIVLGHIVAQCVFVTFLPRIRRPVPANFAIIPLDSVHESKSWQAEVITIQSRTYDPRVQKPYNHKTLYVTPFLSRLDRNKNYQRYPEAEMNHPRLMRVMLT